jgi:hypothetical protein
LGGGRQCDGGFKIAFVKVFDGRIYLALSGGFLEVFISLRSYGIHSADLFWSSSWSGTIRLYPRFCHGPHSAPSARYSVAAA